MKKFGATVRQLREKKKMSLRKFAETAGVSPTFQSKMERDEFAPPARDTIKRMAQVLEHDEDVLLALAGKVNDDIPAIVQKRPQLMGTFFRRAGKLSDESIEKLIQQMDKMK
jgi:transcriptional regulator with XRE-family HTH domain